MPGTMPLSKWRPRAPIPALVFAVALAANALAEAIALRTPSTVPSALQPQANGHLLAVASLGCAIVGYAVGRREPHNRVAWLLLGFGICSPLGISNQYVVDAHFSPAQFPHPEIAAEIGNAAWFVSIGLLPLCFLYFPDGRLLSSPFRWFARIVVASVAFGLLESELAPDALNVGSINLHNPIGIPAAEPVLQALFGAGWLGLVTALAAGLASLVMRYRRGTQEVRQQLRVVILGVGILLLSLALAFLFATPGLAAPVWVTNLVYGFGYAMVPVSVGVAILRYRLYDIDVFISRTLAYTALAALITTVYVAIVVGAGSLAGQAGRPNLLLSIVATAVVAVAFQPLRDRLQLLANRIVFGRRATPYEVLAEFAREVGAFSGDDALARMARVLAEGTGAGRAEVWLDDRPAAVHGSEGGGEESSAEVWHQGERLGALRVVKRRGETLSPREAVLLADLAHQAGLVLRNVGLTQQLRRRLDEILTSRERLVRVQDEERRRLELELRDGAQHLLLDVKRGLSRARDATGDRARAQLPELEAEAEQALQTTRELARGLYPPLLQDRGLAAALTAQARRSPLPVTVEAEAAGRFPAEVEAAVYFCVVEALRNVEKHAGAASATVRLAESGGVLSFEVEDDGAGFDPARVGDGSGLVNLRDRVEALGGDIQIDSGVGRGTRISGRLPVSTAVPA